MHKTYHKQLLLLIVISTLVRLFLAAIFELNNDEVYYRLYAMYPDWSHFDHPPMVGWMIWLTTFGMTWTSELAFRLSAVCLGAVNIWLIFQIATAIKNERTGWIAALLYVSSIYAFIISGTFILPDAPQSFFWNCSILVFVKAFKDSYNRKQQGNYLLMAGVGVGLAFLSKYTALFIWLGVLFYILFYNRSYLKRWALWISAFLTIVCLFPVLWWNFHNDFLSFGFHVDRIDSFISFRPDYIGVELAGEFLYTNPVVFLLAIIAVVNFIFGKHDFIKRSWGRFLLCITLPFIGLFWLIACFRSTLPHWVCPAFITLIPLSAAWVDEKCKHFLFFSRWNTIALAVLVLGLSIACVQIKTGLLFSDEHPDGIELGKNDFSLDMYGWRQCGDYFAHIQKAAENANEMPEGAPIFSFRWFPAANLDYYVAKPNGTYVLALGDLSLIHKFKWINEERGGFYLGMDAWYLSSSFDFKDPHELFGSYFKEITAPQVIKIYRCNKHVLNFYVYQLHNMIMLP